MKKQNVAVVCVAILFFLFTIALGVAYDDAKAEILQLESELNYCKNKPPEIMFPLEESGISDTDKAFLEVIQTFAELQSANITIATPDARIHIEWER